MRKLRHFVTGILLLVSAGLHAQVQQISGKITDVTGTPIPSATIKVKGSKGGTSADMNGAFTIKAAAGAELIISGIGFEPKEIKVGSSSVYNIQLVADAKSLSEVVVTGVGTATSKKKLGIAVESVGAADLPAAPTASIDQALIGKISGAQISSISGNPGDPVNILLRGINTVQGGTKPLILVDGVEVRATDINSLDLSNIERVEVVKGAASSTLYGAQGANGVIQIITKKGRKGATAINYSTSYALNEYINSGHLHKARLHPYLTDANNNMVDASGNLLQYDSVGDLPGVSYVYGGGARAGLWDPRNNADHPYNANIKYYDQFKQVFQTGNTMNNMVSISGASDKSDFNISISNNKTTSPIMKNGSVDRTNLTSNLGFEVIKGLKVRSVTQLIYTRNNLVPGLGAAGGEGTGNAPGYGYGNSQGNVGSIFGFLNTSPFFNLKWKEPNAATIYGYANTPGSYANHVEGGDYLSINSGNPYYTQEYASGIDNKIDIVQSFDANYRVDKFLELDAKYGINWRNENARWTYQNQSLNANSNYYQFTDVSYNNGTDNTGEVDNFQYNTTFQNFIASATFKTDFQNDFHSKLPITTATKVGFDYRNNLYTEYDNYGYSLPVAAPYTMTSTASQVAEEDYKEPFVSYGYLVDQSIDFGDFAGIDGGFRSDWSSAFGGGSSPFTFPRINGFLEPSSLDFWKDGLTAINYFKLRAAYGEAGIQPTPFQRYAVINQHDLGPVLTYSLQQSPTFDTKLNVEVTKETEFGTDFSITGGKGNLFSAFNGSFTWWTRHSDNVIYSIPIPLSTGYTGELANTISMESHGYEFSLNIPVYKSKNFNWDFTTNWGHQTSKINTIEGGNPIILTSNAGSTALVLSPGETIGQIYGHKTITNDNQTDPSGNLYIAKGTGSQYVSVKGALVDTAGKQIQFTPDKYNLGDPNPKFNASFINAISYKFLTLTFQFDWIYGSHLYNQTKEWMSRDGIQGDFEKPVNVNGQVGAWSAYWSSPYYAILGSNHGADNDGTRDYYRESSSFLRLRNAALAFDITRLTRIKYFKKLSVYVSGRNIWTKTKYTGFDPEVSSGSVNSAFDRGVDNSTMPNIKSYQMGLNVAF
jgi:TonB-dependent starch-binding outer membrane protein SusC